MRLRSQVCGTEVIIVRKPTEPVELTCGGAALIGLTDEVRPGLSVAEGLGTGNQLGKRYTAQRVTSLEVLVTKAGEGTLGDGTEPLVLKDAKPLPSSD
ncbi:hypothetical protein [Nocardia arizonensis]|uniref:hypothetical protein n=1 Tax=Nocardia arizonensis TaxID=1141647 RepID=UPI0006D08739|nr:hypothetical protein [Nocardia arizonensis]